VVVRTQGTIGGVASFLYVAVQLSISPVVYSQVAQPVRSVRVARGDTLESIAARHGVSVEELKRLNGISKPRELQIGQLLKLPLPKGVVQIAPGDTLEAIASRQGTTVAALRKANPAVKPNQLRAGAWLRLPPRPISPAATAPPTVRPPVVGPDATTRSTPRPPPVPTTQPPEVPPPDAPPPNATEGQDRAALAQRRQSGQARWKFFGNTVVDWSGWKLHPGGVRVTLVQPTQADLGPVRARATAVGVQCSSLRQTWRVDGAWEPWALPEARSVGQQIVLDLCANVAEGPGQAIPPPAPPAP
jgi:LysM repeat protein